MKLKTRIAIVTLFFILALIFYLYSSATLQHNNAILSGVGSAVITNTDWLIKLTAFLSGAFFAGIIAVIFKREGR